MNFKTNDMASLIIYSVVAKMWFYPDYRIEKAILNSIVQKNKLSTALSLSVLISLSLYVYTT